jgi:hypothetical protein
VSECHKILEKTEIIAVAPGQFVHFAITSSPVDSSNVGLKLATHEIREESIYAMASLPSFELEEGHVRVVRRGTKSPVRHTTCDE